MGTDLSGHVYDKICEHILLYMIIELVLKYLILTFIKVYTMEILFPIIMKPLHDIALPPNNSHNASSRVPSFTTIDR